MSLKLPRNVKGQGPGIGEDMSIVRKDKRTLVDEKTDYTFIT